jgi:hypothetical protein
MTASEGPIQVDLGTSTVTGVRAPGAPGLAAAVGYVGHPVLQTVALAAADTAALGSDFARAGLLYQRPVVVDDAFTDSLGIEWLWADNAAAPLRHPLEKADYLGVARYPRPEMPLLLQVAAPPAAPDGRPPPQVVADAPVSGLLETCFGLRGSWQFMMDIADDWRVANALLDWSLDTAATAYERMLTALPTQPDVVLYGDDYGYQAGMFLSDADFRTFVKPRLRTLFSRISRVTTARLCFHCCGAVGAILPDLADLGSDLLNLQRDARGMELRNVRRALPADTVVHGYSDLRALGTALADGDRGTVAEIACELAASGPVIAAPVDCLFDDAELRAAALGARFVRALSGDDVADLRRLGPVATILDRAAIAAGTMAAEGDPPGDGQAPTAVRPTAIMLPLRSGPAESRQTRPWPGKDTRPDPSMGKEEQQCPTR